MSLPSQRAASVLIAASSPIRSTKLPLMRVLIKLPANCSARFKTRSAKPILSVASCQAAALASRQAKFLAIISELPAFAAPSRTASKAVLYSCKAFKRLLSMAPVNSALRAVASIVVQLGAPSSKSWSKAPAASLIFFK